MTSWVRQPEKQYLQYFLTNPFPGEALAADAAALVQDFALCQAHSNVSLY